MEAFIGQIALFPFGYAPENWAECAGQLLPVTQYQALAALIGNKYGGDGRTTFGLPDLRGRVPVGQGKAAGGSAYHPGDRGGSESIALTPGTLPAHNHTLNATTAKATAMAPAGELLAAALTDSGRAPDTGSIYNPAKPGTTLAPNSIAPNSIAPAGSSRAHNNVQPSLALRYCICLEGNWPMRP